MNQARQSFEKPRLLSLPIRILSLTESKALARLMKTAAQYCLLSMAVMISFSTLETRLHSGEGTLGFEMVSYLFINLAFEDFRKAGQDGYRSVTVWV